PWTSQAQIAIQYVEELRNLVNARFPKEFANTCNAPVRRQLCPWLSAARMSAAVILSRDQAGDIVAMNALIRVRVHGPERVEHEWTAAAAQTHLPEDDRARRVDRNCNRREKHQRRDHKQCDGSTDEIRNALYQIGGSVRRWYVVRLHRNTGERLACFTREAIDQIVRIGFH